MRSAPETFASRADADRWLAVIRADLLRGNWTAPERSDVTLADYTTGWLRQRTPQLRPRTLDLYERLAARWVLAPVGRGRVDLTSLPLRSITPALVREWHALVASEATATATARTAGAGMSTSPIRGWALAAGLPVAASGRLSPAIRSAWVAAGSPLPTSTRPPRPGAGRTTTAQAYRLLHAILATAVDDRLIEANPARIPGAGHVAHAERLPLTPREVAALAVAMPERYRAAILVAAWSGLRPGEVFALRRRDLDLGAASITVRQTLVEISGQPLAFGPPKTAAGRRVVALPAFVVDELRAHLARHVTPGPDALLFTTSTSGPVAAGTRGKVLARARVAIDRPDITWHHLRHTGATLAAQAGATQAELMRRIGHSSPRAAALYQHANLDRDTQLAHTLNLLATADPA
jgi:integrase